MEELDLTLVATQQNAVSVLLKAEGFDPSDFEWQRTTVDEMRKDYSAIAFRYTVSKLVHVKSGYYFQFEKYRSRYAPAHQVRTRIESWERLIDRDNHLRDWLFNLRLELPAESQMEMMDDGQAAALVEGPLERLSPDREAAHRRADTGGADSKASDELQKPETSSKGSPDKTSPPDTNDHGRCEAPNRSAAIIAYLQGLVGGTVNAPKRPLIHGLSEAALLRIEAAVLDVEANARDKILGYFAAMTASQEHSDIYQAALDSDEETVAKWLTTTILREHIGFPIFDVVAGECCDLPHVDLPASLEAAAQFALAYMPPDEGFVPELRSGKFKLYLAKSIRRAADALSVSTKAGREARTTSDEVPERAMGDFLTELFDQFDQEEQARIRAAEASTTEILAQGTAAAKGRRRVAESLHDNYWLLQPENDARADSAGVVFVAYVNALWRKTDADRAECIDDFLTKVEKLIEPILTIYGHLGKGLIEELRAECHRNAWQVHSMLRTSPASATSSTEDSAASSSQDGAGHAGGHSEATDASEQSETETGQTRDADRPVISVQPPAILEFSDSWRKRMRGNADRSARSARHLGRNGPEVGRQEDLLKDARVWAAATLRETVSEVQDVRELKERVVKQTWDHFVPRHRYYSDFRLGYREFESALWEEEWPSLEDCALEAAKERADSAGSQAGSVVTGSPAEARGEGRARLAAIPPQGMAEGTTVKPKSIERLKASIDEDIQALVKQQRSTLTWEQQMMGASPPPRTFNLNDPFEANLFSVLERGAPELTESAVAEAVQQDGDEALRPAKRSAITEQIYPFIEDRWLNTGFDPLHGAPGMAFRAEPTLNRLREVLDRTLQDFSPKPERAGDSAPKAVEVAPAQPATEPGEDTKPESKAAEAMTRPAASEAPPPERAGDATPRANETRLPGTGGTSTAEPLVKSHRGPVRKGGRPVILVDGERIKELRGEYAQVTFARFCKVSVDAVQLAEHHGRSSNKTISKIVRKLRAQGHEIKVKDLIKNPPQ